MATTTATVPPALPPYVMAIEQAANIALLALSGVIPGGPLIAQVAPPLESALNSLIMSIKEKQQPSMATYLALCGAEIDTINVLKAAPGIPADALKKLDEYSIAIESGIVEAMAAQKGYDPSLYAPVTPIQ